ncbi:MAG TPA: NADH-quinone oxidoreductase subunit M, partial [Chitinophagaceae bacterium]
MNLLLLIAIPLLTAVGILLVRNPQQVRWTALAGSILQFILAIALLVAFRTERLEGNTAQMLFEQQYN